MLVQFIESINVIGLLIFLVLMLLGMGTLFTSLVASSRQERNASITSILLGYGIVAVLLALFYFAIQSWSTSPY